jgi:hypothetical protein
MIGLKLISVALSDCALNGPVIDGATFLTPPPPCSLPVSRGGIFPHNFSSASLLGGMGQR